MTARQRITEMLHRFTDGATSCNIMVPAVYIREAIAELEAADLTPEQRAEKRLREAYPEAHYIRIRGSAKSYYVVTVESGTCCTRDWLEATSNGRTPDEAVDRLLARVK